MEYAGKILPTRKHYGRDEWERQRLPVSERGPGLEGLPGHGKLIHSTVTNVARSTANTYHGDYMRKVNKMFQTVAANEMPTIARGRASKDYSADPLYVALKDRPVAADWFTDGKEYSEDMARKFQSKIAAYAKAGAGTFSTSLRGGKVYIRKNAAEYTKQRGE